MVAEQSWSWKPDSASRWGRASTIIAVELAAALLGGCSSGGERPAASTEAAPTELPSGTLRLPFLVDDYFVPNGCFGDGDCQGGVLQSEREGCSEPDVPVQGSCRVFTYTPLAEGAPGYRGYLGVLFQSAGSGDTGIGRVPPRLVEAGARRVVFWAKVDQGPVPVGFRAGGANDWEGETDPALPYKDEFGVPQDVVLTGDYAQIDLDLSQVRYTGVVSPFGWAIGARGSTEPIRLSISDVRWE